MGVEDGELVMVEDREAKRVLKEQGLRGSSYRFWVGDSMEMIKMQEQAKSIPLIIHPHDLAPHVFSFVHHMVNNHGKNSFMWFGPSPSLIIIDPEKTKDVFNRKYDFPKPHMNPLVKYIATGVTYSEGEKWAKHRKIIDPAFNLEKLKILLPNFYRSCNDMMNKWEKMLSSTDGTCEMDVWPWLKNLTEDVISQAAFGSSYEEGKRNIRAFNRAS